MLNAALPWAHHGRVFPPEQDPSGEHALYFERGKKISLQNKIRRGVVKIACCLKGSPHKRQSPRSIFLSIFSS